MRNLAIRKLAFVFGAATLAVIAADIPAGTEVSVRLGQTISSDKAKSGDSWTGTLANDIVVSGNTVAKKGDPVEGKVVTAEASGRLKGKAVLDLQLSSINGTPVVTSTYGSEGSGHTTRNAASIGGGAAAGAVIGAIAGGGRGAAIGSGIGGAAGAGGAAATGKKDIKYPVETILSFTIK